MSRFIFFLSVIILPTVFSWWFFIPLSLLAIYLIKLPYEIILAAFILDSIYYFGGSFWAHHLLLIFSSLILLVAYFLSKRIHWQRKI